MAERERVEDLGIVSESLHRSLDLIRDLQFFLKAIRPTPLDVDLEDLEFRLETIQSNIADAWHTARFGDDDE